MPKRNDIKTILIIGSGPIVIGQACEFDYSGSQACRVLKKEGYRVVLVNSNPATIMTDPELADATYIEPLNRDFLTRIIEKEKPDALLPTLGGQTALNLSLELHAKGVLDAHGVEMIGVSPDSIEVAEDRSKFKEAMQEIGLDVPISGVAHSWEQAEEIIKQVGLPVIVRPAFILGGKGTGIARTDEEFEKIAKDGLLASPINEILVEQSIAGWKEYELELMRDKKDNQVVVCSIENLDPMGIHTGDSITVAPAQTLTDVEYQKMRDAAFAVMSRVGVETGGSNVQFAVNPKNGDQVVIEMNPRVSRSSALASKATGFPIAKIAALLAVGYTLDEIPNDITKKTPASFEPTIDYVVTKIPRWAFEKFPEAPGVLGTQMQSVGEAMAIGRTFPESLQKGVRSLEQGRAGLNSDAKEAVVDALSDDELKKRMSFGTPERIFEIESALRRGMSIDEVYEVTKIDPWFLHQINRIPRLRAELEKHTLKELPADLLRIAKQHGFSDEQIAHIVGVEADAVRDRRKQENILPTYKQVDTCAAEFASETPYFYSAYEDENESKSDRKKKVVILGSGPNRIGQGIEFDYSCVHAAYAASSLGYQSIMVNCNPETVSTDYDTSDKLYFEPLTTEDVNNVLDLEKPDAVIVSLGGQTPLKIAQGIDEKLIAGTSPTAIDAAEDRKQWAAICKKLDILQPPGATVLSTEEAVKVASEVGYPVLIRPSYVLGGRAMEVVYKEENLKKAVKDLLELGGLSSEGVHAADRPVLVDRFLEDATEVDVDVIRDKNGDFLMGGIMEHIEEAGVHSGDSACVTPSISLSDKDKAIIEKNSRAIAEELGVVGLLNVQYAVKDGKVYVLEANPRASRTVPYLAKGTGVSLAKIATMVVLGKTLNEVKKLGINTVAVDDGKYHVKEAVMAFNRFPEADTVLGPEMKSTGEVMGIDESFELAYLKSQYASWQNVPKYGVALITVDDYDKPAALEAAKVLVDLGFGIAATNGTANYFEENGVIVAIRVAKIGDDHGTDLIRLIEGGVIQFIINSPTGRKSRSDEHLMRQIAGNKRIICYTTARAGLAAAKALAMSRRVDFTISAVQEISNQAKTSKS